jgi:hypothetical protein
MNVRDLINQLAAAEERFAERPFVAPVTRGARVRVRIEGIVSELHVEPPSYEGWAVLKVAKPGWAQVTGDAPLARVREYLALFPRVTLVLCGREKGVWWGVQGQASASRVRLEGAAPLHLSGEARLFEWVRARWDGARFLYEGREPGRDPSVAAYLREALEAGTEPEALARPTLSPPDRTAYGRQLELRRQAKRRTEADRLREAVTHSHGEFRDFTERDDHYVVSYLVDGAQHVTTVRKEDLSLLSAGICLDGEDEKFDLASLVGVIREGRDGQIVRVGENEDLDEETYRLIHPPRPPEPPAPPRRRRR